MNFVDAIRFVAVFDLNSVVIDANHWVHLTEEKPDFTINIINGKPLYKEVGLYKQIKYHISISRNTFRLLEVFYGYSDGNSIIRLGINHRTISLRNDTTNDTIVLHTFNTEPMGEDEFFQLSLMHDLYGIEYSDIKRLSDFYHSTLSNLR